MKNFKIFSRVIILIFFGFQSVLACICLREPPPCYAYWENDAVFVGTVTNITQDGEQGYLPKVEIKVEQNYRGMNSQTAYTFNFNHSCALTFEQGEKLLFYGSLNEKGKASFGTMLCSRTSRFDENLIDFEFFNSLNSSTPNYWIWGTISKGFPPEPLEGIRAEVLDKNRKVSGISDKEGNLKISVSKEGKYLVRVFIPKGISFDSPRREEQLRIFRGGKLGIKKPYLEYEVEVKNNKCGWFDATLFGFKN